MKFYVETFGCQMNSADSQEMGRHLLSRGFSPSSRPEEADFILVNTCTVRQHAEHRALSYLGRLADWKAGERRRVLVVAGCAAERLGDSLKRRFPQVSLVVGAKSIGQFQDILEKELPHLSFDAGLEDRTAWSGRGSDGWSGEARIDALLPGEELVAQVTIMRGCDYACSYCIVPAVRGPEIYRPARSVLSEVARKAELGVSEVLLLGQTVNSYRPAGPNPDGRGGDVPDFAALLRAVDKVPGVRRIRFMSPHPRHVTEPMVRAMAESPNVCRHIHMPVQSGSDAVLKRMRRNYTRADYLRRVEDLRRAMPDLAVTTDFIAGFPGETEEDFEKTLSLAREADLDGAFVFKYSPRPGTPSAEWPDDVPDDVKEERHARLLEVTDGQSDKKAAALTGSRQEVLVETTDPSPEGRTRCEGRTRAGRKAFFLSDRARSAGDTVWMEVASSRGRVLEGRESAR